MGAGGSRSARRQGQGAVIRSSLTHAPVSPGSGCPSPSIPDVSTDKEHFESSLEEIDASLECHVLQSPTPRPSYSKQSSVKSLTSTPTTSGRSEGRDAKSTAPTATKLTFSRSPSSSGSTGRPAPSPTKTVAHKQPPPGEKLAAQSPPSFQRTDSAQAAKFFSMSPLQHQLSGYEDELRKKTEENGHLRNEIKLQQGAVSKLRTERNAAKDGVKDALERCRSIEMEKDRILNAFDAFRDKKEAELSALLRTKEDLEKRLVHASEWHRYGAHGGQQGHVADMLTAVYPELQTPSAEQSPGEVPDMSAKYLGDITEAPQQPSKLVPTELRVYMAGCMSMTGEVNLFLEHCAVLSAWCARNGCQLTVVNGLPVLGSTPQLVRYASPSLSQVDVVKAVICQEIEHCDMFVTFLAEDTHRLTRDEVEACLSSKEDEKKLCVFCFRESPTGSHQTAVSHMPLKSAPPSKNRQFSVGGNDAKRTVSFVALEKLIIGSHQSQIVAGGTVEDRAASVFSLVDVRTQELLGQTRSLLDSHISHGNSGSTSDMIQSVDNGTDHRLDVYRRRKDAFQQSILEHHSQFPLVPALEKYIDRLDEHVSNAGPLPPLLIIGDPGCGKTTLLAHWIANHQQSNRTQRILYHFVLSPSSASADVRCMTQRFVCHLMQWLGVTDYRNPDLCQIDEFPTLLDQVSSRQTNGVVVVLDGIEQIEEEAKLSWLLEPLPVETRVIVACNRQKCPPKWRTWPTLDIEPISPRHTKLLLRHFLGPLHNLLVPDQETVLSAESRNSTSNPLYTVLLSRHLSRDRDPSTLAARIQSSLRCESIGTLMRHILSGVKAIITVSEEILKKVFCFVFVSQDGLVQDDLLALCDLTWISWLRLRHILKHHFLIVVRDGMVLLNGPAVRSVVEETYLQSKAEVASYRSLLITQLVSRFKSGHRSFQLHEELTHQFLSCHRVDKNALEEFLLDTDVILDTLVCGNCPLLLELWSKTGRGKNDIALLYSKLASPQGGSGSASRSSHIESYRLSVLLAAISSFAVEFLNSPTKGVALARQCLSIREEVLDPDHPSVAQALHCLANIHLYLGQVDTAVQLLQQATSITEDALGMVSRQMADHFCLLGLIAKKQNRQDAAEQFQLRAISTLQELAKRTAKPVMNQAARSVTGALSGTAMSLAQGGVVASMQAVKTMNQQATLFYVQGDYKSAEKLFLEVLATHRQVYGDAHTEVAQSLSNLGMLYTDLGRFSEAEPLLETSLAIRQQTLGGCDKKVLASTNLLAVLYRKQGEYTKAQSFYKRSLSIEEKCFGPNHLNVASALSDLAATCYHLDDWKKALMLHTRAHGIYQDTLGSNHPKVAECEHNILLCKQQQEQ